MQQQARNRVSKVQISKLINPEQIALLVPLEWNCLQSIHSGLIAYIGINVTQNERARPREACCFFGLVCFYNAFLRIKA